jgi:hypothetical protein
MAKLYVNLSFSGDEKTHKIQEYPHGKPAPSSSASRLTPSNSAHVSTPH